MTWMSSTCTTVYRALRHWTLEQVIEPAGNNVTWWGAALAMDGDWLAIADVNLAESGFGDSGTSQVQRVGVRVSLDCCHA